MPKTQPEQTEWTDETRVEFANWCQFKGLRPTEHLVPFFEAEMREDYRFTAIKGLAYGPFSMEMANGFARTSSVQDAVVAQAKDANQGWWVGFYYPEQARKVAKKVAKKHSLVFIVPGKEA
jgi:hypothetical protein